MQSINSIRPVTLSSSRFSGHRCKHTSLKRKSTRSIRYLRSAFIPACSSPRRFLRRPSTRGWQTEERERIPVRDRPRSESIPSKKFRSRRGGHYSCKALTTSTSSSICVSTRMGPIRGRHTCSDTATRPLESAPILLPTEFPSSTNTEFPSDPYIFEEIFHPPKLSFPYFSTSFAICS